MRSGRTCRPIVALEAKRVQLKGGNHQIKGMENEQQIQPSPNRSRASGRSTTRPSSKSAGRIISTTARHGKSRQILAGPLHCSLRPLHETVVLSEFRIGVCVPSNQSEGAVCTRTRARRATIQWTHGAGLPVRSPSLAGDHPSHPTQPLIYVLIQGFGAAVHLWVICRRQLLLYSRKLGRRYVEPAIDLHIPERAQLAEILYNQPADLSFIEMLEPHIQAAELRAALCDKRDGELRHPVKGAGRGNGNDHQQDVFI